MLPDWIGSSPFMQRRSVDLPEPLRPMRATTWPRSTVSETPFRTSTEPKLLCTLSMSTTDMENPFEISAQPRKRKADQEIDQGDDTENLERRERGVVDELPGARQLDEADDRDDGGVLHQLDEEAHRRRQRDAQRLGDDDVPVLLPARECERGRCLPLLERDRLDRTAPDLGEIGADIDAERQGGGQQRRQFQARER